MWKGPSRSLRAFMMSRAKMVGSPIKMSVSKAGRFGLLFAMDMALSASFKVTWANRDDIEEVLYVYDDNQQ